MNQVDIIVLTHNAVEVTKDFLGCLFRYTEDFRLTLVDNGSGDGTREFLGGFEKDHPGHLFHFNPDNRGVIGGRNLGFELSGRGEPAPLVLFLDNDQFVQPGWFGQHRGVLERGFDLVGVEGWQMDAGWMPTRRCSAVVQPYDYVGAGGLLAKREVLSEIGLFDERYGPAYFEDPDLCLRAHEAGYKVGWNAKARVYHLPHQTLGKTDWRPQFAKSHAEFIARWRGHKHPGLRMTE